jgi:hypothetical protein
MAYLNCIFMSKQKIGLEIYKKVREHKFLVELYDSLQYTSFIF